MAKYSGFDYICKRFNLRPLWSKLDVCWHVLTISAKTYKSYGGDVSNYRAFPRGVKRDGTTTLFSTATVLLICGAIPPWNHTRVACCSETCAILKHVSDWHGVPFRKKNVHFWNMFRISTLQTSSYPSRMILMHGPEA